MNLFNKILIANRGEIAVRVIRSAKDLGIRTVAIYSSVDKLALHAEKADEAYCIGETELSDTYLNIQKIIGIAKRARCEAIHPGYGFLAENPEMVAACEKAGIIFIGPGTEPIRLMGNKIEARNFVKEVGIPMTAGVTGDFKTLIKSAKTIPFPLLVKAAAGGGGKGMRIVYDEKELEDTLEATSREAKSYFGDGTVYIEQYIEEPRHIEVQVIGDNFGNVIHLFERECSIQRRYQKIIEESPSPTLNDEVRKAMGEAAVQIASKIGYNNAGTIEFLVDKNLKFYFLEMNTRVQVEHPVTEMVTGIDIVREQILIAAGNKLQLRQQEISQYGHAIECRIYAEDPGNNFLPSPGEMVYYHEPSGNGIRVDAGMAKACIIHSFFDPMISKLIVWGENREIARFKMIRALQEYSIHGIKTNIPYLIQMLQEEVYINNKISTKYCDIHTDSIVGQIEKKKQALADHAPLLAFLIYDLNRNFTHTNHAALNIWQKIGYWRDVMRINITGEYKDYHVEILSVKEGNYEFLIDGKKACASSRSISPNKIELWLNDDYLNISISEDKKGTSLVSFEGLIFQYHRKDMLIKEDLYSGTEGHSQSDAKFIFSPMPGKVIKINVKEGEVAKKGTLLLIVEAMKMENNIVAQKDVVIEKVNISSGDMVDTDTQLIVISDLEQLGV